MKDQPCGNSYLQLGPIGFRCVYILVQTLAAYCAVSLAPCRAFVEFAVLMTHLRFRTFINLTDEHLDFDVNNNFYLRDSKYKFFAILFYIWPPDCKSSWRVWKAFRFLKKQKIRLTSKFADTGTVFISFIVATENCSIKILIFTCQAAKKDALKDLSIVHKVGAQTEPKLCRFHLPWLDAGYEQPQRSNESLFPHFLGQTFFLEYTSSSSLKSYLQSRSGTHLVPTYCHLEI